MTTKPFDGQPLQNPEGQLEQTLIQEFLRVRGYDSRALEALPEKDRKRLLTEASVHAAGKLAEVEARAHFVHDMHGSTEK
jgi:hypothetical protein